MNPSSHDPSHQRDVIDLPPPRRSQGHRGLSPAKAVGLVFLALVFGTGAGYLVSTLLQQGRPGESTASGSVAPPAPAIESSAETATALAEIRLAVGQAHWLEAREACQRVLEGDPNNIEASATLSVIEKHLEKARAMVKVEAAPDGALVRVGDLEVQKSPAVFAGVPAGIYQMVVEKEGFVPVERQLRVEGSEDLEIKGIVLERSSGNIEVSSVPAGVEFKIVKASDPPALPSDPPAPEPPAKELVLKEGKTPAKIEELGEGDYKVFLSLPGFPVHEENVKVRHSRMASVSHVFASGGLKITSDPIGAEVWLTPVDKTRSRLVGVTPLSLTDLPVGRHQLELRHLDWPVIRRSVEVTMGDDQSLEFAWKRSLVSFVSDPPGASVLIDNKQLGGSRVETPFQWELPDGNYEFTAKREGLDDVILSREISAGESSEINFGFQYGAISLNSQPSGAAVVSLGVPMGRTPLRKGFVRPGHYAFTLSKDQYRSVDVSGELLPGQTLEFNASLNFDPQPVLNRDFTNHLGSKMVWINEMKGWVAETEVRQSAFQSVMQKNPSYFPNPEQPVDSVTWYDAKRFCEKLTVIEQGRGTLPKGYAYRLPTDQEWTFFSAGEAPGGTVFASLSNKKGPMPVGSSQPNALGLRDVQGNVWEWCEDWYSLEIVNKARAAGATVKPEWAGTSRKILRGASWLRSALSDLDPAYRLAVEPGTENRNEVGFRVVLMPQ